MELDNIKSTTTWNEASDSINNNNAKIQTEILKLQASTYKNKGYFANYNTLISAIPTASLGSRAYVGTNYPYAIYYWDGSMWVDSGETGGDEQVELSDYYTKIEIDDIIRLLTPLLLPSEEAHEALVESGEVVEGQIYYTIEE